MLGSVGVAIYRGAVGAQLPAAVPDAAAEVARDTLGGAVAVAAELPAELGAVVLEVAREAFVAGMHLTAGIAAVVAVGLAALAVVSLRGQSLGGDPPEAPSTAPTPEPRPRVEFEAAG